MSDCICEGNWRLIIKECEHLIGRLFNDKGGAANRFAGVLHSDDDYYYVMVGIDGSYKLLSCVGNLDGWGYELIDS